jgi:N-acetylmuramoyl-L-alanine amidase
MRTATNGGHFPGLDPGAIGPNGLQEADVARNIALIVHDLLTASGHQDQFIQSNDLDEICSISNEWGADIFISIHCNGHTNSEAHGTETWAYEGSAQSVYLARCIQDELIKATGLADRGVKQSRGLYVLKHTYCPAILIELCFISNSEEEKLLASPCFQEQCAKAIGEGIKKYIQP